MQSSTLYYEELGERCLWVDGESSFNKEGLYDRILSGKDIDNVVVNNADSEIDKFTKLTGIEVREKSVPDYSKIQDNFLIPENYFNLKLETYFLKRLKSLSHYTGMTKDEKESAVARIMDELDLYRLKGLEDVLRTAIYIVDVLKEKNIVWGPGRGSACCSYLLYLTELHDVDSIAFELSIDEFLR